MAREFYLIRREVADVCLRVTPLMMMMMMFITGLLETKARRGDGEYVRLDEERRWVLLKIPRGDIDGVGEGK